MLSFDIGPYTYLWAVNDSRETVSGTVRIQLFHLDRNTISKEIVREVKAPLGKSAVVVRLDEARIGAFRRARTSCWYSPHATAVLWQR